MNISRTKTLLLTSYLYHHNFLIYITRSYYIKMFAFPEPRLGANLAYDGSSWLRRISHLQRRTLGHWRLWPFEHNGDLFEWELGARSWHAQGHRDGTSLPFGSLWFNSCYHWWDNVCEIRTRSRQHISIEEFHSLPEFINQRSFNCSRDWFDWSIPA